MNTNRSAAAALIAGSLAGLATMALHPTGADMVRNASAGHANVMGTVAHGIGIVAQPLLLAGTLALTLRLRSRRDLAVAAYAFFAMGSLAILIAAAASGFIAPAALDGLADPGVAERSIAMDALYYTRLLNQAFAKIYVMLAGCALLFWSAAILIGRDLPRSLGVFAAFLGAVMLLGIASSHLTLDIHGMGAVVIAQGIWMVWAAIILYRLDAEA